MAHFFDALVIAVVTEHVIHKPINVDATLDTRETTAQLVGSQRIQSIPTLSLSFMICMFKTHKLYQKII
jgi:hypothetical protein